ncbi:hypothetical protein BJ742DRAFT_857699 [Cladochytrium replicatum]|nr:hypothetical protein BJ742DRAFT_857699 [Cladochytrium replicatum]
MFIHETIPFLPGNTFTDVTKTDYRKAHTLNYLNGYAVQFQPTLGIGLDFIEHARLPSPEQLVKAAGEDPRITYGDKQFHTKPMKPRFVPAHVAFDKVVLRFDAYFKQTVHESTEQHHLRKVRIYYYVEDDSIAVVESPVENSCIPQGALIKRQRLPKNSTELYTVKDLNLDILITFYGKTFHNVSCDKFTEYYMRETEGINLNPPQKMPSDPYQVHRNRQPPPCDGERRQAEEVLGERPESFEFYCIWDDRDSMFGEVREFVMHYYLVDDCVEVREIQKPNNGRDPFPILLRRQQLPKAFIDLPAINDTAKYTWKDFRIGSVINVLGRKFLIRDCDEYTATFYEERLGLNMKDIKRDAVGLEEWFRFHEHEMPPYNGFGSVEDSLGSCKCLVLKPPKKDFIKMLENEHKVLRFESKRKEDKDRRFVISHRLADDMMTIYELPQRNAGTLGGKFMERTRVPKPGSSLSSPNGPSYYDAPDLFVGTTIEIFRHRFVLLDADEYVFNYMEQQPDVFVHSNVKLVVEKVRRWISELGSSNVGEVKQKLLDAVEENVGTLAALKERVRRGLESARSSRSVELARKTYLEIGREYWKDALNGAKFESPISALTSCLNGLVNKIQ